jgi:phosphoribosyl-AMP cyclohydrolase / phosphoribosyl-ATP pyrophosphohydrolase
MTPDYNIFADGLVPAVVQDPETKRVLMVGFMNNEALRKTLDSGRVSFFSRSRQTLWTKGETSGNFLEFVSMGLDCDKDTLLIFARPAGPVCHTGTDTCFGEANEPVGGGIDFLELLEATISTRRTHPNRDSYVAGLFREGANRIAQKLGEEAVETVIAAMGDDRDAFVSEAADLLFHLMILLNEKGSSIAEVTDELRKRRK